MLNDYIPVNNLTKKNCLFTITMSDEELCRTCLKTIKLKATTPLHSTIIIINNETIALIDLLYRCTSLKINPDDNLPQTICLDCQNAATKSYQFREMCLQSDRQLSKANDTKTERLGAPIDNVQKHSCTECTKSFQYRSSLLKHIKRHNAPTKTCPYCTYTPTSPYKLAKHMSDAHANLKKHSCQHCDKTFFKSTNLKLHLLVHSGVKKHTCEVCGMSFALAGNLAAHRRLHTGEKPYTCTQCGRGFTQQSALRSHEAGHSNRKDFVCSVCGAAFSRAGALRNHQKRHSNVKPFSCTMCSLAFTFSSELKRHITIHTGDKRYSCDVCGRSFNRSTNLTVHKRIHTGETPHVCTVCGKGFIQAHCLKTHMNTHAKK